MQCLSEMNIKLAPIVSAMRVVPIVILLVLLSCAQPQQVPEVSKLPAIEKAVAILAVHSGEVLVNDKSAIAGQELKVGDIIRTLAGKASVVFFDSSVLRLDENTEVAVKRLSKSSVSLKQASGQTWSRILKVSGIQDYKIETPTTVATVRGTGFGVKVADGDTKIVVKEGKVHVASYEEDKMVAEAVVTENMELEVVDEAPEEMEIEAMEADVWIDENVVEDEEFVDAVVEEYMKEHPKIVEGMRDEMTVEEIEARVEDFVMGEVEMIEGAKIEEIVEEPVEEPLPEERKEIVEPVDERISEPTRDEMPVDEPKMEPVEETRIDETADYKYTDSKQPTDQAVQ